MAVVSFVYADWSAMFPELASVTSPVATGLFNRACLQIDNTDNSFIVDASFRTTILYLATAHLAKLNATINGVSPSDIVGRVNSATEGSVSVQAQMDLPPGSPQWWAQTRYGIECWQALAPYRNARFVNASPRQIYPNFPSTVYQQQ